MDRLQQDIGSEFAGDINAAMASGGMMDNELMRMVENKEVDLVDKDQNLVLQNQISQLTNNAEAVNLVIDSQDS